MCLISLGWILFRANALAQAKQMFRSALSPGVYSTHFLSGSLYLLVLAVGGGYAMILLINDVLDKYSAEPVADSRNFYPIISALARYRWYWIPPLYGLALFVVLIVTHTQDAGAAQFMYRQF